MLKVLCEGCAPTKGSEFSAGVDLFIKENLDYIQSETFGGVAVKVKGYEKQYVLNEKGDIFSLPREGTKRKIIKLKQKTKKDGYKEVSLYKDGLRKSFLVHRLVMLSFAKFKSKKLNVVNHLNNNRGDNKLQNLEWTTSKGNALHRDRQGRGFNFAEFNRATKRKLTENDIVEILELLKSRTILQKEIAKRYGVTKQVITNIKQGVGYVDVLHKINEGYLMGVESIEERVGGFGSTGEI